MLEKAGLDPACLKWNRSVVSGLDPACDTKAEPVIEELSAVARLMDKVLRAGEGKILRRLEAVADLVEEIEDDYVQMSDAELRAQTDEFRARLEDGETLDDLMPEAVAAVRE